MPPTKSIHADYEAERLKLMNILQERMRHSDVEGIRWAQEALAAAERNYARAVQVGTMRDQFASFKQSQPFGWRP